MVGMPSVHPCLTCGACCATFRVSFPNAELDSAWGSVPVDLTEPLTPSRSVMRGTAREPVRCEQLVGVIGASTSCRVHPLRPTPCREFAASWEDGTPHDRCDAARARHGLAPLRPSDWGR